MAANKGKAKIRKPLKYRGDKGSLSHIQAVLRKYYSYGTSRSRFKDYKHLQAESKKIQELLKESNVSFTVKNIKSKLSKKPKKEKDSKNPKPDLPEGWNEPQQYFEAPAFFLPMIAASPEYLEYDASDINGEELKGSWTYTYEEVFKNLTKFFDDRRKEAEELSEDYFLDWYIKLDGLKPYIGSNTKWTVKFIICDASGDREMYGYDPEIDYVNIDDAELEHKLISDAEDKRKKKLKELEDKKKKEKEPEIETKPTKTETEQLKLAHELEIKKLQLQKDKEIEIEKLKAEKEIKLAEIKSKESQSKTKQILADAKELLMAKAITFAEYKELIK